MVGKPASADDEGRAQPAPQLSAAPGAPDAAGSVPRKPAHRGKTPRERLDLLLVSRGLAPTRERARALILAGQVLVDGRVADKAGMPVSISAQVALAGPAEELRYVSRGGLKLERALDTFGLNPTGDVCLDVGASTGGFTDVLLRRGATRVYAVDVGHGQLAWTLRNDPRVVVMERTNIRALESLPEPIDCAVIDVSFISLRLVLPKVAALLRAGGWVVALVKPQFEAGKAEADRGAGVIADRGVHTRVLRELLAWPAAWDMHGAGERRLVPRALAVSPIAGREGNREYLLELVVAGPEQREEATPRLASPVGIVPVDEAIAGAVAAAFAAPREGTVGADMNQP